MRTTQARQNAALIDWAIPQSKTPSLLRRMMRPRSPRPRLTARVAPALIPRATARADGPLTAGGDRRGERSGSGRPARAARDAERHEGDGHGVGARVDRGVPQVLRRAGDRSCDPKRRRHCATAAAPRRGGWAQGFLMSSGIAKISPDFAEWVTVEGEQVRLCGSCRSGPSSPRHTTHRRRRRTARSRLRHPTWRFRPRAMASGAARCAQLWRGGSAGHPIATACAVSPESGR